MFTGIIEGKGRVARLLRRGGGARLEIRAPGLIDGVRIGDSMAVNGACVTITELNGESFACDLVPETVARTNLGILDIGEEVNIERPMRATDRFGGHIVQGHVDAVGLVRSRRRAGAQEMLEVTVPFELNRYLAPQGSVTVDGVSLTVVAVDKDRFRVALIPHTMAATTLGVKGQGASVNVEVDVLSKYVERHLVARASRPPVFPVDDARVADAVAAGRAKDAARAAAKPVLKPVPKPRAPRPGARRPAAGRPTVRKPARAKRPAARPRAARAKPPRKRR